MTLRSWILILLMIVVAASFGCAPTPQRHRPSLAAHQKTQDPQEEQKTNEDPQAKHENETAKAAPFLVKGEVTSALPTYRLPEKFRTRLKEANPELIVEQSEKFQISDQHILIRAADSSITFTGTLRIPGKQDEAIELRCNFDQASEPWSCADMFPTDERVAAEKRIQATVNCLDTYRCERLGARLYVVINGVTESQHFQTEQFAARIATSGDSHESEDGVKPLDKPVPSAPVDGKKDPRVLEKPTKSGHVPPMANPQDPVRPADDKVKKSEVPAAAPIKPNLDETQLLEAIDDANSAVEIVAPIPVPRPVAKAKFSIPNIEKIEPEKANAVKNQAIGFHSGGVLRTGDSLNGSGAGFRVRERDNRNFGTDLTLKLLKGAAGAVEKNYPKRAPLVVCNISKKGGGELCGTSSCHASHQTGLDVDIAYPSRKNNTDMWPLCGKGGCSSRSKISDDFDEERFFHFVKSLVGSGQKRVIAYFVDQQIKAHMCRWAKARGEDLNNPSSPAFRALQAMKHADGHDNHVHVRFACPGNRDCRDSTVSLARGTGCP